jgi:hypothetical protein
MNQRIQALVAQASYKIIETNEAPIITQEFDKELFAQLMIRECAENFAKVWYEQGLDIRGAELDKFMKRFNEHFGVES